MEIAKEKFIETFKKECDKAVKDIKPENFRATRIEDTDDEFTIEIISNEKVSFYASKISKYDATNTFDFSGKILFGGFIDYKSIELTEEEFEVLYDYYYKSENDARLAAKNKIITEGEKVLALIL